MATTSEDRGAWTVGRVAAELGVTVRTLHHYDEIGLVRPHGRSTAGYRLYTRADLERLAAVVALRRLGLTLDQVADAVAGGDVVAHLRAHRVRLTEEIERLGCLIRATDTEIDRHQGGRTMTNAEMREMFGEGYDEALAEAEERWGDSEAFRESQRRTASYSREQWEQIKTESADIETAFAAAFRAGTPVASESVLAVAERHREHTDRWFYPLDHDGHRGLADLYVSDPRFAATYDESFDLPGLSAYVRDAIHANADRRSVSGE